MAKPSLIFVLILLVCAGPTLAAEEAIRTPSDQRKEAVGKVGKAPATIGKSLQDLTGAAKERLRQTFSAQTSREVKAGAVDLTVEKKPSPPPAPVVKMDESQRDPFRPMTLRAKTETVRRRENLSPLERFDLSQLKLVGIVWDNKDPRAMVEDTGGLGYVVKVGTPIGSNDGKVKAIYRNEMVVEEFYSDDYGARKKRDVGIKLMTE